MFTTINEWKKLNNVYDKIFYHGTTSKFTTFKINSHINNPTYGGITDHNLGIFFTDNLTMAKWFAGLIEYDNDKYVNIENSNGEVISAKLNIKNPWILSDHVQNIDIDDPGQTYFDTVENMGGGQKMRETLQEKGYDSVIVENATTNYYEDGSFNMYIVFDPTLIKIIK